MSSAKLRLACIGAGYFAQFHVEAWKRIPQVELVAICDAQPEKAKVLASKYQVEKIYDNVDDLLDSESLNVVDIITPPHNHLELCRKIADSGLHIICQKPLAPSFKEAVEIANLIRNRQTNLYVHENYRFQPWYRKIKELLEGRAIGDRLHSIYFQCRMGDGWQHDAYLARQPYFRTMPRLLVYETGIHFIDTFRFLFGEVDSVYADLRKLNKQIEGEDSALIIFNFSSDCRGIWDANRFNESTSKDPRYTFGEMLIEGDGGSIRLNHDGAITLQQLGLPMQNAEYHHERKNFGGDCVYFTQLHLVQSLLNNTPAELNVADYLQNLKIQEAIYESSSKQKVIKIK